MESPRLNYFDTLVRHETRLWAAVERALQKTEGAVTLARFQALRQVSRTAGTCRVQDVADALLITVGAASRLVDRLVADGLLQRAPHPSDRRSTLLLLTREGERAYGATTPALEAALEELLGGLDSATAAALEASILAVDAQLRESRSLPREV